MRNRLFSAYTRLRNRAGVIKPVLARLGPVSGAYRVVEHRVLCRQPEVLTRTRHGFRLFVHAKDVAIGRTIILTGTWQPAEADLITRHLREGACFVDVGANVGFFSLLAASIVGDAGRVIAIEPDPDNSRLLQRSVEVNRYKQVAVLPVALSDNGGITDLHRDVRNLGNHSLVASNVPADAIGDVRVVRVDTLASVMDAAAVSKVDLLKIDVQGFEARVLAQLQWLNIGALLLEFWPAGLHAAGSSPEEFADSLLQWGRVEQIAADGTLRELSTSQGIVELATASAGEQCDLLVIRRQL